MKQGFSLSEKTIEEVTDIDEIERVVKVLSKKIKKFIKKNGFSKQLKDKADLEL